MKISKKILTLALSSTLILTIGCSNQTKNQTLTIENKLVDIPKQGQYKAQTIEFDLGDEKYISDYGRETPYKLRGIMSVPEGEGKFPIVLITHGSHDNEHTGVRFDTGFKYLTEKLAQNGYIAVSIDAQNAYVWSFGDNEDQVKIPAMMDKHIQKLKEVNEGKENIYNIDLKDKIDFTKLALIGHSRGGETIFEIAKQQQQKGQNISAMLSIEPTMLLLNTPYTDTDINTSIIVGEYDGDVFTYDGIGIYDKLNTVKRENPTSLVFLEKANHNYFNDNLQRNDARITQGQENDQLSKEDQQLFLTNYAVDFLNASLKNKSENTIYDTLTTSPNKIYGKEVKTLYKDKNTTELVSVENTQAYKSEDVKIEATQDSILYPEDKLQPIDTSTHGSGNVSIRKLITMKWEKLGSEVNITPNTTDFTKHNSISLDLLQDSTDKLNKKGENQQFTIQLKDKKGNTASVELDENVTSLDYKEGNVIVDKDYKFLDKMTPATQLRIPMDNFKTVDLKNIKEISLIFNKKESGSIIISDFSLK